MTPPAFLGSTDLYRILADLPMTCLDIGARGGFTADLLPLASSVDAVGFEPDPEECERLNRFAATDTGGWRSLRFIPTALGDKDGAGALHLYRQRGCSSLLQADVQLAEGFCRGDYYELEDTLDISLMPLDKAASSFGFRDAVYMKIDVQGAELDVFRSGPELLAGNLLAIRIEVSFIPIYHGQPLFSDIDAHLRVHGFIPMSFLELHHWRRLTKRKDPDIAPGPIPYSLGQMVHGDVLYFRDPGSMPDNTPEEVQTLLKAAFLALAYGYVDHAAIILDRPNVTEYLNSKYGISGKKGLSDVSRHLMKKNSSARLRRVANEVFAALRHYFA
jgi:FkbM family methyltransferase